MRTTGNDMPLSVDRDRGQADSRQEGTSMTDNASVPRSRRALLAAAAGGAAALAASAALPLAAVAHDADDVALGTDNPSTSTTSITDSTADNNAFTAAATGTGFGVQ